MLKLYKRGRAGRRYWETWEVDGAVVVHEGNLGERGKAREFFLDDDQSPEQFMEELAQKPRAKGMPR